ncbi:MAG: chromosomal replication initiator protein DnaA [Candidatus Margulisbacteria bacterium]|nr:chromosomal replication initiator protein DnaA [Candidatus Margulisiibacteriota bacterium]
MTTDLNLVWNKILPLLEKSLNRPIYEALVSSTKPLSLAGGNFVVAVPNQVVKDWLSKYCVTLLEQELRALLPDLKAVTFVVGPEDLFSTPIFDAAAAPDATKKVSAPPNPYLNSRYSFDTFVIGHGNRFAHAAALAVAESPAIAYNPFFLYGGVGLGKTHLMQAIGHRVLTRNPKAIILYTTSETFTNELINSIRDDKTTQFRNKYRNIDVLMVDDVQFIAGKERTQEEFFHTFNALYESHKQIVVSSDRPPKEMLTLEERLRSRFEWGLTADIQPPDFETRIAILKKKAEISGIVVSDDIMALIASKIISNIRKLEGALIRIVAYSSLSNQPIDVALVEMVLKDIVTAQVDSLNISIDLIKKSVADYYGLTTEDMTAKIRTDKIATARQIAMYLSRELTNASLPKVGGEFGGRDHTTVMHACEKIRTGMKKKPELADAIKNITSSIKKFTRVAV